MQPEGDIGSAGQPFRVGHVELHGEGENGKAADENDGVYVPRQTRKKSDKPVP